jgi:hypothetical protein
LFLKKKEKKEKKMSLSLDIKQTDLSKPFYVPTRQLNKTKFKCCRYPLYFFNLLYGILKGIAIFCCQLICCRATYQYVSNEELSDTLLKKWASFIPPLQKDAKTGEFYCDLSSVKDLICNEGYNLPGLIVYWDKKLTKIIRIEHIENKIQNVEKKELKLDTKQDEQNQTVVKCYKPNMKNQDAWNLAKMYALTNAQFHGKYMYHPFIHFIQNVVIVSFQKHFMGENCDQDVWCVPLMKPHMEFVLSINESVLLSKDSVLNENKSCCSCTHCWDIDVVSRESYGQLFEKGNSKLKPYLRKAPTVALQPLYEAVYNFVDSVYKKKQKQCKKEQIVLFIKDLVTYLHYPQELLESENLEKEFVCILSEYIFNVSIRHSIEHESLTLVNNEKRPEAIFVPLSLNAKLPRLCCACCNISFFSCFSCCCVTNPVSYKNNFKQRNFQYMFTEWTNNLCCYDTRLTKTSYNDEIIDVCFQENLVSFMKNNDCLVDINRIAASIGN